MGDSLRYKDQFYVETRYPADIPVDVEKEEAQECIIIAEKIYNLLIRYKYRF